MKVLLFGKNGQVGWELNRSLQPVAEVVALGRADADFSDPESLRQIVRDIKPDVIVNAVAYTAVDRAEDEEELAGLINAVSPGVLAEEASKVSALLVHYSTDYVFDGEKDSAYVEADQPNPINAYGRTKLAGEVAISSSGCDYLIFRTSWVYSVRGNNFLLTMISLAEAKEEINVVDDQTGVPTYARYIADTTSLAISRVMHEGKGKRFESGIYHLTASGAVSWYGFAGAILKEVKASRIQSPLKLKTILPITSDNYPFKAERPLNSVLATGKIKNRFDLDLPQWDVLMNLCVADYFEYKLDD